MQEPGGFPPETFLIYVLHFVQPCRNDFADRQLPLSQLRAAALTCTVDACAVICSIPSAAATSAISEPSSGATSGAISAASSRSSFQLKRIGSVLSWKG